MINSHLYTSHRVYESNIPTTSTGKDLWLDFKYEIEYHRDNLALFMLLRKDLLV